MTLGHTACLFLNVTYNNVVSHPLANILKCNMQFVWITGMYLPLCMDSWYDGLMIQLYFHLQVGGWGMVWVGVGLGTILHLTVNSSIYKSHKSYTLYLWWSIEAKLKISWSFLYTISLPQGITCFDINRWRILIFSVRSHMIKLNSGTANGH